MKHNASRTPQGAGVSCRELPPVDAARALDSMVVVDVREPSEFVGELGHIPGAVLMPMSTLSSTLQGSGLPSIDKQRPLLVVCRSGRRACRAAAWLDAAGYPAVFNLAGGMIAWNERSLPSTRSLEHDVSRTAVGAER